MQLVYQKKISICLNRGRKGSLGNDNILDLNNAERPQVTKGLEKKTTFEAWVKCVAVLLAQQLTPRKCRLCSLGRRLQKFPEQKQLNYLLMYAVLVRDKKNRLEKRVKEFSKFRGCFEQLCILIDLTQCMESVYFKRATQRPNLKGYRVQIFWAS